MRSFGVGRSYALRFAPDESSVAAIGRNVVLWRADRRQRIASAHHLRNPSSLDFTPAGDHLVVKDTSGECILLRARSLELVARLGGKEWGEGAPPVVAPDGAMFVDGSWDGDLLVRSVTTGEVAHHEHEEQMITHITCSPDRSVFAYATTTERQVDVKLRAWPFTEHGAEVLLTLEGRVHALSLDRSGRLGVIAGYDPALTVWSIKDMTLIASRPIQYGGSGVDVALSPAGAIAVVEDNRAVYFGAGLSEQWHIELPYQCSAEFSASGRRLAVGSWQHGRIIRVPE